ncbi:ABC transporter ATP-binding protein [Desulfocurvus sp. DL9XJH121]
MSLRVTVTKGLAHFTLDVDLCCPAGSFTVLVGPSGAGKTTLMRMVAGLGRPDGGRIAFGGETWVDTDAGLFVPPQKRGLALVFQDYALFPHMTVARNVAFAARDKARVPELLEMFGIGRLASARPCAVSGGERQRAALCQALAREPRVLLLDEPFSALDVATRLALRAELKALTRALGVSVLHVTHDLDEARYLADSLAPLVRGRLDPSWPERQYRLLAEAQAAPGPFPPPPTAQRMQP